MMSFRKEVVYYNFAGIYPRNAVGDFLLGNRVTADAVLLRQLLVNARDILVHGYGVARGSSPFVPRANIVVGFQTAHRCGQYKTAVVAAINS
jgi:hypothetical protein